MTNSISEISQSECIFIIGSNTSENHPIIALEVMKAIKKHGAKLIVVDPLRIDLANHADLWLRLKPGTNIALINGLLNIIISENLVDHDFINNRTEGFEEVRKIAERYTPDVVSNITDISIDDLYLAARLYGTSNTAMILYGMGITQHVDGTDNVMALANLVMATGNVGKENAGLCPLRGQNNVQGACDMGALPNAFPGYQSVNDKNFRNNFEDAWQSELPSAPGLTLVDMLKGARSGKIKGMYIMGEEPALTDPDSTHVSDALKNLDFLVTQNIFLGETGLYADIVLPGASFAEKDGTFTNTERRVQRVREAIPPIADSKPDWEIIARLSRTMGYPMKYSHPSQIMEEISRLVPIYGGINYPRLEQGGLQWPCQNLQDSGTKYLHRECFSQGKGKFMPIEYQPARGIPSDVFPINLITGRNLYHWHAGSMSHQSSELFEMSPRGKVEINPEQAKALECVTGDIVEISSLQGTIYAVVEVSEKSPPGVAFIPMHFKESPVNQLTSSSLDPLAKTPGFKICPVNIQKVNRTEQHPPSFFRNVDK
jgi:predicted molibdopterin-dependent oxidoreductase YjgC